MWRIRTGGWCWESRCQNRYERMSDMVNYNLKKKIGERERVSKCEHCSCVLLGPLDESVLHLAAGSRKSPPMFSFHSSLSLLPHVVSFILSLSPSYLPQVFRYLPPGCCWRCWEVQGALLSSCQGLCGPRGAPAERTRTVLLSCRIPVNEGYGKEGVGWVGGWVGGGGWGGGGSRRVELSLEFVCVVCVCDCRDCLNSPPALSRPILSLEEPQGRQMHLPEIHTPGPDAYLPHLQGFTETLHVPHTLVSTYSLLKEGAQKDIKLYCTLHLKNLNLK